MLSVTSNDGQFAYRKFDNKRNMMKQSAELKTQVKIKMIEFMKNFKMLLTIGFLSYIAIDLIHFVCVRIHFKELDGVFYNTNYESFSVSIAKWIICLVSLVLINDIIIISPKLKHLMICLICGLVISLDMVFGPFRGSFVSVINLLPILSLLSLFYFYYKIDLDIKVRLFHYALAISLYFISLQLAEYSIMSYFYL
jgi:hypothetical protein